MEVIPTTPLMIKVADEAQTLTAKQLIKIWGIPLSIIAERLRQSGIKNASINELNGIECPRQSYLYHVAMRLLIKDLRKTVEVFDGHNYNLLQ